MLTHPPRTDPHSEKRELRAVERGVGSQVLLNSYKVVDRFSGSHQLHFQPFQFRRSERMTIPKISRGEITNSTTVVFLNAVGCEEPGRCRVWSGCFHVQRRRSTTCYCKIILILQLFNTIWTETNNSLNICSMILQQQQKYIRFLQIKFSYYNQVY